jgi:signal transduction histidine kinase
MSILKGGKVLKAVKFIAGKFRMKGIRSRFFHAMIFIGIIPLLCLGWLSIFSMNTVIKNETINYHTENLGQKEVYIDLVMSNIESLIANISGIEEVNNALVEKPTDSSYDRLSTQAKIGYILSGYTNLNGLVSIDIITNYGIQYHVGETLNVINVDQALCDRLFAETEASDDFVYWSGIETNVNKDSRYENVIMATKILKPNYNLSTPEARDAKGLLIISYNPAVLGEAIGQKHGDGGYGVILDSKKRILYHPDARYIGKTLSDSLTERIAANEGNFEQTIEGQNMIVIYNKTQKGDWTVADFIPVAYIYSNSNMVTLFFILVVCIAIVLLIIFQAMLSNKVLKPISEITDTFRLLKNGELESARRLDIDSDDELGELRKLFNGFIDAREDITTQKKLEKMLNEQNLVLQKALGRLKETQAQMLNQEKLAGIGQLAAGIAHEINNPLGFVTANFDILKKYIARYEELLGMMHEAVKDGNIQADDLKAKVSDKWKENKMNIVLNDMNDLLSDTEDGLKRIAGIVNGLKSFSRIRQGEEYTMYDLNEGVKTTLLVATNELKYHCDVTFERGDIPLVYANGGEINQVILNMLMNAAYAIEEKFKGKKGEIIIKSYADEKAVYLNICDNGFGMTEDVKRKIFEPFFTTKPVGKGTGLGLGIAYDIICNKHGGSIDVESKPGDGTCFLICLPVKKDRNLN